MLDFALRNQVFEDNHIPISEYFLPIRLDAIFRGSSGRTLLRPQDCTTLVEDVSILKIFGKNGVGKSHLLYCFGTYILTLGYVPVYFDLSTFEDARHLTEAVENEIFLTNASSSNQSTRYCFLFDNYGHFNTTVDSYLNELMNKYLGCKFVFTTSEQVQSSISFEEVYAIMPIEEAQAYALWEMIDASRKSNVNLFIKPIVESYPKVFKSYLTNPLFASLLYRVSIFFQAARGTDFDAFKPLPNRNRFYRLRYAMEHVLLQRFKLKTRNKDQKVVKNNYQTPRSLANSQITPTTFVIEPHSNGIGDLLWFSHLPRIAKESGKFDRVLVVKKCNNELIWDCNPYVDGYTEEINTAFKVQGREVEDVIHAISMAKPNQAITVNGHLYGTRELNLLDWVMLRLGLDNGKRFNKPELYYQPNKIKELENKVIYDPYWWSNPRIETRNFFELDRFFRKHRIQLDYQMRFIDETLTNSKYTMIPSNHFDRFLSTYSLFDFCDVLASVKHVYCLTTGTAHLTDALSVATTVLMDEAQSAVHHSVNHNYVNILTG